MIKNLIYVHGFLSSSQAKKSVLTEKFIKDNKCPINFFSYDFPDTPLEAYALLDQKIRKFLDNGEQVVLIGSSMGGFFSMCMSAKYNLRAALINPCVFPWEFIPNILGRNVNPYTKNEFVLTPNHIADVRRIYDSVVINQNLLALFVQRGDEVLPYKDSCNLLANSALVHIENDGCHTFDNYENCLPEIIRFLSK